MTKLTDLDTILLSTAAQRYTASLIPPPDSVANAGARIPKAITALLKRGFAEERETQDRAAAHRTDGDVAYGVFITDAGKAAIGIDDAGGEVNPRPALVAEAPRVTKAGAVIALLQRAEGATLAEMIAATGWLPHTTRAALTGLRKKGHAIDKYKRDDTTCYRIAAVAA